MSATTKVYDATTVATLGGSPVVAALGSDAVGVGGTPFGFFADKNVGTAKSVAVGGYALSGADAGNYLLVQPSGLSADITPATLQITGVTAANKVYDGSVVATVSGSGAVAALGNDVVTVSGTPLASFASKDVGTAKTVLVSGLSLGGPDAANYLVGSAALVSTADITPATLQVNGLVASNKVYDATVAATLSGSASVTPLGNDIVAVSAAPVGSFVDKNVGTGKSVSIGALSLTGPDAGNYTPVAPVALSADITPATLTVTGVSASNKVYDATTIATLGGSPVVAALGSDAVGVGGTPFGFFADKNVGTAKSVAVGGYALSGADAGNYLLVQPSGLSAAITPATLQITGVTAANKVYDGSVAATVSGSGAVAALGDDVVTISGTPLASFASKDVGTSKTVLISGLSLGGPDAANYLVGSGALVSTADITPATLRYVAAPVSQVAGLELPVLTGTVGGFVAAETLQSATTGTLGFTTTATIASVAGQYAINGGGLAATNYVLVQDAANATALTLAPSQPELIVAKKSADAAPTQALQLMARPTPPADPGLGGVVDLVPPPSKASSTSAPATPATASIPTASAGPTATAQAAPSAFEPVTLSALSNEALVGMLDARVQYKKELFADAVAALEKNSALADMPPCRTRAEALAGGCVLTAALKRELQSKSRPSAGRGHRRSRAGRRPRRRRHRRRRHRRPPPRSRRRLSTTRRRLPCWRATHAGSSTPACRRSSARWRS